MRGDRPAGRIASYPRLGRVVMARRHRARHRRRPTTPAARHAPFVDDLLRLGRHRLRAPPDRRGRARGGARRRARRRPARRAARAPGGRCGSWVFTFGVTALTAWVIKRVVDAVMPPRPTSARRGPRRERGNEELERVSAARPSSSTRISHEVRTPLNVDHRLRRHARRRAGRRAQRAAGRVRRRGAGLGPAPARTSSATSSTWPRSRRAARTWTSSSSTSTACSAPPSACSAPRPSGSGIRLELHDGRAAPIAHQRRRAQGPPGRAQPAEQRGEVHAGRGRCRSATVAGEPTIVDQCRRHRAGHRRRPIVERIFEEYRQAPPAAATDAGPGSACPSPAASPSSTAARSTWQPARAGQRVHRSPAGRRARRGRAGRRRRRRRGDLGDARAAVAPAGAPRSAGPGMRLSRHCSAWAPSPSAVSPWSSTPSTRTPGYRPVPLLVIAVGHRLHRRCGRRRLARVRRMTPWMSLLLVVADGRVHRRRLLRRRRCSSRTAPCSTSGSAIAAVSFLSRRWAARPHGAHRRRATRVLLAVQPGNPAPVGPLGRGRAAWSWSPRCRVDTLLSRLGCAGRRRAHGPAIRLEAVRGDLEAASRHKTQFLATMSHELRTPLNAIIGFSEVLQDELFGPLTDKQREYARDLAEAGHQLLALVNDILDLAKVDAGRMELDVAEDVDIADRAGRRVRAAPCRVPVSRCDAARRSGRRRAQVPPHRRQPHRRGRGHRSARRGVDRARRTARSDADRSSGAGAASRDRTPGWSRSAVAVAPALGRPPRRSWIAAARRRWRLTLPPAGAVPGDGCEDRGRRPVLVRPTQMARAAVDLIGMLAVLRSRRHPRRSVARRPSDAPPRLPLGRPS